jgi:hypothetical protein
MVAGCLSVSVFFAKILPFSWLFLPVFEEGSTFPVLEHSDDVFGLFVGLSGDVFGLFVSLVGISGVVLGLSVSLFDAVGLIEEVLELSDTSFSHSAEEELSDEVFGLCVTSNEVGLFSVTLGLSKVVPEFFDQFVGLSTVTGLSEEVLELSDIIFGLTMIGSQFCDEIVDLSEVDFDLSKIVSELFDQFVGLFEEELGLSDVIWEIDIMTGDFGLDEDDFL